MRRKILTIAQAMMLAVRLGNPASAAEPTTDELSVISGYLEANDVQGLRAYLEDHPELAEGNTPLAGLLRRFLVESVGNNDFFRFRPDRSETTDAPSGGTGSGPDSAY